MKKVFGAACLLWVWAVVFAFITQFYWLQLKEKLG